MINKVSVVIPVYNGADYLAEAIQSALDQTYKNIEILVINDGSNDDGATERLALSYGNKIRYFRKENGGVASALNTAIAEMTGDYFTWLSHDDLYTNDKIEKEMDFMSTIGRVDVVVYSNYSVFTNDAENAIPVFMKGVLPEQFRYWITVENRLHGCTLLIPRSVFAKVGCFNESLKTTQDYDLWFRMAKHFQFIHTPEFLVKARSHSEQGSNKMSGIALTECNTLLSNFICSLEPQEIISATTKSLSESYAELACSMFNRGFNEAGILANKYAKLNDTTGNKIRSSMTREIRYIGNQIVSKSRKILPLKIKHFIKSVVNPTVKQTVNKRSLYDKELKEKFSEVYDKNIFGGIISRSGAGSDLVQTEVIRRELSAIVKEFSIQTFLDAPCGDWYWMKDTNLDVKQYIGVDIVEAMIEKHKKMFGSPGKAFLCQNLAADHLPKADLIFSRDCLVHLSFKDSLDIITNFKKSGAKYLLTTTFVDRTINTDLAGKDSFWRPLNMQCPPFNFPAPLLLINEGCTEENGQFKDKSIGLWLLNDISIALI